METLSYIGAAQRLGKTVEEVKDLVKTKQLKESEPGRIIKASVYAFSGISPEGRQTKKTPGRKPAVVNIKDAAALLRVDVAEIKRLVEEGTLEIVEGAGGKRGVREATLKMYKKKIDDREERVAPNETKKTEETMEQSVEQSEDAEDTHNAGADAVCASSDSETVGDDDTEDARSGDKEAHFDLEETMKELFPGIQRLPEFVRKAALAQEPKRYSKEEVQEAVETAYMRGKLAVYASPKRFEGR
ncbi:MAG: hypothetical protein L3J47_12080, partial [Sulfurovum sp.]|nr:hypothetical protein [Sulfurovum sp.]